MGMYDEVLFETVCPNCKRKADGFQSKSGPCALDHIKPWKLSNFYTSCRHCGAWIDYQNKPGTKFWIRTVGVEGKPNLTKKISKAQLKKQAITLSKESP